MSNSQTPNSNLTPEQLARLLKTKDSTLGKAGDAEESKEVAPIAWSTDLKGNLPGAEVPQGGAEKESRGSVDIGNHQQGSPGGGSHPRMGGMHSSGGAESGVPAGVGQSGATGASSGGGSSSTPSGIASAPGFVAGSAGQAGSNVGSGPAVAAGGGANTGGGGSGGAHETAATLLGVDQGNVTEDKDVVAGKLEASGQLTVSDPDAGQAHFIAQPNAAGTYGSFTLDASGHWTYAADNSQNAIQTLKTGEQLTDTLQVTSADGTAHTITITLHGTDDVAKIGGIDTGTVSEDGTLKTGGSLSITDPDAGQAGFTPQAGVAAGHGSFTFDANGVWTYTLDNTNPTVQGLKTGDQLTDTLQITSLDGTTHTLTVHIDGKDDGAKITGTTTGALTEDFAVTSAGKIEAGGQLAVTDADASQAHFVAQSNSAGTYGSFSITEGGQWTYVADNASPTIQTLKAGETVTDTITVKSADGTPQQITVTLTGTNDVARIAGTQTGAVTEDSTLSTHGTLTVADVDRGEAAFTPAVLTGSHGNFTIDGAGHWVYTLDNSNPTVQALGVGDKLTDLLTVTSLDGTTQQVTVTINGSNDAAQIGGSHTGGVTEDTALTTQGSLSVSDKDQGQGSFTPATLSSSYGQLTVDAGGHWTYTLDNANPAVQALGAQGKLTDTITVTSLDGTTQQITISINGTNDAARIAGTQTGDVTEDQHLVGGRLETGGQLTITDVDAGEEYFAVQINAPGTYGSFNIDPSGHWTYTSDNSQPAFQALKAGESLSDTLQVTSADGTRHTVSVTIHGTNDAPVLAAQTQAVTEDGALLSGKMVATDIDKGDTQTFSTQNPPAGFTLNADGSYQFDPSNAAYQHLTAGQTQDLTIPVTVTDSAGATSRQNLLINITGTPDGAIIGGVDAGSVTEDAHVSTGKIGTSGQLTVTDPDAGEDHFVPQLNTVGSHQYGSFTLDAAGHWTYSADNSQSTVQQLKVGERLTDSFTVSSADGTTHTVIVTLVGTNDIPVLTGQSHAVTEDGARLTGQMQATDVDKADTQTFSTAHPPAGFTLNTDGSYSFDPSNAAYQRLLPGQTQDLIIPISVKDSAGAIATQNLTITVTGTNDAPHISGPAAASLTEDAVTHSVTKTLTVRDADAGDTATWALVGSGQGTYGQLVFDAANHRWTYNLDNADSDTNALHAGQRVTEIFQVKVTDGAGATATQEIRVNIAGTNDAPTIAGTVTGTVIESDPAHATIGGTLTHADVDSADTFSWTLGNGQGTYGSLTFDATTGQWGYTLDESRPATQGLNAGQTVTETFTVTGVDNAGAKVTQTITVAVQGTNDNPVVAGAHEGSVVEDRTLLANGTLTSTDLDRGDTPASWQVLSPQGTYGNLAIDSHGGWTYRLDVAASQSLKAGATVDESFVVRVTDQHGGTADQAVTIHVTGSNDAPKIDATQAALSGDVTEDKTGATSTGGTITSGDPDLGDTLTWAIAGASGTTKVGQYGSFTLGADGSWSYALDHAKANALAEGANVTETFNVHVTDAAGERSTAAVTVRVHGTNDGPAISGQSSGDVTENSAPVAHGTLASGDPDRPDPGTWAVVGNGVGQYGNLVLDNAGHWTYALANTPNVEALGDGDKVQETFAVKVTDSHGLESTHQITVNVHGSNDAPTIAGTTSGQVAEDILSHVSGTLSAADVDRGDHATFDATTFIGNYGQLSIDKAGLWTYELFPADPHVQALAAGQRIIETFNVAALDEHGGVTHQPLTVTVVGTNDVPHISGVTTGVAIANMIDTAQGRLVGYDKDNGDTGTWSLGNGHGRYGELTLNAQGEWTYQLDMSRPETRNLQPGQQVSESFTVRLTDHEGAQDTSHINVTVFGTQHNSGTVAGTPGGNPPTSTNPATGSGPTVIPPISVSVTEDDVLQQTGRLPTVQPGSTGFTWQISPITGVFGDLVIDRHGHWQYHLHDGAPQVQALSAGQTVQEIFSVAGHDPSGHQVQSNFVVDIHGTNDKPQIVGVDSGVAVEDVHNDVTGSLAVIDPDAGESAAWQALDTQGKYGSFSVDQAGNWHYQLDPNLAQGLNAGQSVVEVFRVQVTDKAGAVSDAQEISVQVQGTADGPKLRGVLAGPVNVAQPSVAGVMPVLDHDIGDQHTFSLQSPAQGAFGSLTLSPDGHYQYQLDPNSTKQIALGEGQQVTETFMVKVTDTGGHTYTRQLTVQVQGTNDAPTIRGALATSATEDTQTHAHGQLTLDDPDTGDTVSLVSHERIGQYGVFDIGDDGKWTYALDNLNPAVQALGAGQTLTDRVQITIRDEHGLETSKEMVISVRGTNDVPVIAGDFAGAVTEDGAPQTINGQLTTTDADTGDHTTWTNINAPGTYGTFTLGADGAWHYQLNNVSNAVQALAAGQVVTEQFIAHGTDGHGGDVTQSIEVSVTGANDAARITGQFTGAVTEDHAGGLAASGRIMLSDVDAGQGHLAAQTLAGQHGTLTLLADGNWRYAGNNADPAVQSLGAGKTLTDSVNVATPEGGTQAITITFTGVNDRAVIAGTSTASVTEDSSVTGTGKIEASGQLTVTDVDTGEAVMKAQTGVAGSNHYGNFSIDAAGHWTYSADNNNAAIQGLKAGATLTDSLTVQSADGTTHTLTVTLTGTNDAPVLQAQTQAVAEDGARLTGHLIATDADSGDTRAFSMGAPVAGFTLNADGSYSFDPANAAYQHLAAGQTQDVVIAITVTDSAGATATQNLSITVTGANDGAVIAGTDTGKVIEDQQVDSSHTIYCGGNLQVADTDAGEAVFAVQHGTSAQGYGSFVLGPSGGWTYSADNTNPAIQSLKAGATLTDSFTVHSADGTNHTVTVTIQGTNDAPTVTGSSVAPSDLGNVTEDTAHTYTQADLLKLVGGADVDTGDTLSISAVTVDAQYGAFSKLASGDWKFTPAANAHHDDIPLTISVSDGHSTTQAHGVLDITPVTDAVTPALSISAQQHVIQFGGPQENQAAGVVISDTVQLGHAMQGITVEMTLLAGTQVVTTGSHGATLVSYSVPSNPDEFYIWNPDNLTLRVGSTELQTGVSLPNDGHDHRLGFSWDSHAGTFDVMVDGKVVAHKTGFFQGASIRDGGKFLFGNDQDSFGGGISNNDAFHGKIFSGTIATQAVAPALLATASLNQVLRGQRALETDIKADSSGHYIDATGGHQITTLGAVGSVVVEVDTAIATPNPGATLRLKASWQAPADSADHVTHAFLTGMPVGTVVTDGNGHTVTVSAATPIVDIVGWTLAGLTATPPQSFTSNFRLGLDLTTAGPDGAEVQTTTSSPVIFDRTKPVPDATIGGTTSGTTPDDDTAVSGLLTVTDSTAAEAHFVAQTDVAGTYGKFSVTADGHWTYTPDNRADAIANGHTASEKFLVTSADGTTQSISVTVTGTNDAPTIAGGVTGAIAEDTATTSGTLSITDADSGESQFKAETLQGGYGSLEINTNGQWTYTLDNSLPEVQALGVGEEQKESYTVTAQDGTQQNITITITGTNDVAQITSTVAGDLTEDAVSHSVTVDLSVTDADLNQAAFNADSFAGSYGSLDMDPNTGVWTYTLDNKNSAVQALAQGESLTDTVTVTSIDGTTHDVAMNIHGTNDAPIMGLSTTNAVTGGGAAATEESTGDILVPLLKSIDLVNLSAGQVVANSLLGKLGENPDDALNLFYQIGRLDGMIAQAEEKILYHQGAQIKLVGPGGVETLLSGNETRLGDLVAWRTQGADHEVHFVKAAGYGEINSRILDPGSYELNITDGMGTPWQQGDLAIADPGTYASNAPAIAPEVSTGTLSEDNVQTASGTLHAHDTDSSDSLSWSVANGGQGAHGTFAIDVTTGQWTYTLNNSSAAVQGLKEGEVVEDVFTVEVTDGTAVTTQTMTMTVTGRNDAAVVAGELAGAVTEDVAGKASASGQLHIEDPDAGETCTFEAKTYTGQYGTLTVDTDGHWQYSLDNGNAKVQGLNGSESTPMVDSIFVNTVGGPTGTLHIEITGTNDLPVVTNAGADLQSTAVDTPRSFKLNTLLLNASDVDLANAHLAASNITVDPSEGTVTLNADGTTFTFTPAHGFTGMATLHYSVSDPQGGTVADQIRVGVGVSNYVAWNEAPQSSGPTDLGHSAPLPDIRITQAELLAHVTDGDGDASINPLTINGLTPDHGTVSSNADGSFTYHPEAGYTGAVSFTYQVADQWGGQLYKPAVATLTLDANNVPVISAQSAAVTEDAALHTGTIKATDADAGDTLTFTTANPVDGFTLNADGSYTFDASHASYQHLAGGATQNVVIPITVTDAAGATSTENLSITVTGANDGPTVTGTSAAPSDLGTANEDTARTFTQADLLKLVGAADAEGDQLSIAGITVDAHYGSFAKLPSGDWQFSPAANVSGEHVPFSITVSDGHATTIAHAQLNITAVADTPTSSMAESVHSDFATPVITDNSGTWEFADPAKWGWQTDNASGKVEHGVGAAYGDTSGGNIGVIELEGAANDVSNLYREIHGQAGARYSFSFDLSGRTEVSSDSAAVQVLWEGKVIDTIRPADHAFGFVPHTYDLVATGDTSRIELKAMTRDGSGPVVDNLGMQFVGLIGTTNADMPVKLNLHLADTDGSEVAGALFKGLPVGFAITDGTHTATVQTAGQAVSAQGWNMGHLAVRAPAGYQGEVDITVSAQSVETSNQNTASVDYPLKLSIFPPPTGQFAMDTPTSLAAGGNATFTVHYDGVIHIGQHVQVDFTVGGANPAALYLDSAHLPPGVTQVGTPNGPLYRVEFIGDGQNAASHAVDISIPVDANRTGQAVDVALIAWTQGTTAHSGAGQRDWGPGCHAFVSSIPVVTTNAIIGGDTAGTTLDDDAAVSGVLTITDHDAGQAHFVAQSDLAGTYGKFSVTADGHWTYAPDNRADAIANGHTVNENFVVTSADGTTQRIAVTLTGSNDGPTVTGTTTTPADLGATAEDTTRTFTQADLIKLVGAADADTGDTLSISAVSVDAQYGSFAKQPGGDWKFTPAANVHHDDIPLTISVSDGHVTTQAHGVLDITPVTMPANPSAHGQPVATPVAGSNDGSSLATFTHAEAATVTVKEDVGVHAETAATVRNHLAGTYFAHEINSVSGFDTVHQGFQQIEISDSDSATDNAHFAGADGKTYAYRAGDPVLRIPAEHGSFEVFGSGGNVFWKFHANNDNPDVQALNEGDQIQDQIFVVSKDGTHLPLTAIIQGTDEAAAPAPAHNNAAPTVTATTAAPADLGVTLEDTARTFSEADLIKQLGAKDVDNGDKLSISDVTVDAQYGSISKLATGDWKFIPAANVSRDLVPLTITISDGHSTTTGHAEINITAVGDAPTAQLAQDVLVGTPNTDLAVNLSVRLADSDGSEVAGALFKGLPVGFAISDGTHTAIVQTAGQALRAQGWDMDHLVIRSPAGYQGEVDITVSAQSVETSNQNTASVDYPLKLSIFPPGSGVTSATASAHDDVGSSAGDASSVPASSEVLHDVISSATVPQAISLVANPAAMHSADASGLDALHVTSPVSSNLPAADNGHDTTGGETTHDDLTTIPVASPTMLASDAHSVDSSSTTVPQEISPAANPAAMHSADASGLDAQHAISPVIDYLQFADTSHDASAGVTRAASGSAVDDYLSAAGVDPHSIHIEAPDMPPTEVLVDSAVDHQNDANLPDDSAAADAAAAAAATEHIDQQVSDDPQHHGV